MPKNKIIIEANNLAYKLDNSEEYLFQNINFSISDSDRIGLIGINGSGKSTLLKVISGIISPTDGKVNLNGTVEYVPQLDLSFERTGQKIDEYIGDKNLTVWKIQSLMKEIFSWDIDIDNSISSLSGGQFMKLKIVAAISKNPELLILDEPTNHIDLNSIKALESFIAQFQGGIISVSHNKAFLNNTINQIWELNNNDKTLDIYGGNYDFYINQKTYQLDADARRFEVAQKKQRKIINIRDKMQERVAKREKGAKKKLENRRILKESFNMMKSNAEYKYGKEKRQIDKRMESANNELDANKLITRKKANINFKLSDTSRKTVLSLSNYSIEIEHKMILENVNLNVSNGDRICIVGPNGSGKSVLIKSIIGKPKYIKSKGHKYINPNMDPIYLDQNYEIVNPEISLLENVLNANKSISSDFAKSQLGKLQFDPKTDFNKPAASLSGGETAKLALGMVSVSATELVLLDEPVNNLDIETIDTFEKTLLSYKGALIVISHDESFIENIKTDRSYIIKNKTLSVSN